MSNFVFVQLPSKYLEEAVEQMASLPGIGKRTALRLVLNLLNRNREEIQAFVDAFVQLKSNIRKCEVCDNLTDNKSCFVCENPHRDPKIICVVEDIRDILAIEATSSYKGVYHVLNGVISPIDGIGPADLNIPKLLDRVEKGDAQEVIFALSATMEGDTTCFYLYKKLRTTGVVITSLSRGVSVGSELQYTDEVTLGRSLLNRQPFRLD